MMHPYHLALVALDTARERQIEGERLARLFTDGAPHAPGTARRSLARLAASASRAAAAVAQRLDDRVALADARHTSRGV